MDIIDLNTWEEFEDRLKTLEADRRGLERDRGPAVPKLLFRGQTDAAWNLDTTLERYGLRALKLAQYYRAILAAKPQIEAHTEYRWETQPYTIFRDLARDSDAGFQTLISLPAYEYMAYLRHHGFPSPLLDWTRSPYVAAYFAFREKRDPDKRVAIFAYREHEGRGKSGSPTAPAITVRGPYVSTHRRHFVQQCQYTMCYHFEEPEWRYASHDEVFDRDTAGQDRLWKFTLPGAQRERVLARLDEYNLNAYSLFASEESLMEMMAARELLRLKIDPDY